MKTRRNRPAKKGQALVELAILFPFFLLVIVGGIIDFGFAFTNFITLQEMANATAQYAAEGNRSFGVDNTSIITYANQRKPGWWSGTFTVETPQRINRTDGDGVPYSVMVVTLSYRSPVYTPFYQTMFSGATGAQSIPLRAMAAYQIPSTASVR